MSHDAKVSDRLRSALNTASLRANQYMQVVQKKVDLGAIHKKIEQSHMELGKRVDDLFTHSRQDFFADRVVQDLLEKLASLKQAAALLEEEVELIRAETSEEEQNGTSGSTPREEPPES